MEPVKGLCRTLEGRERGFPIVLFVCMFFVRF